MKMIIQLIYFLYYDSDNLMKIRRLYLTDKIEIFETNISNEFNQKIDSSCI